MEPHLVTLTLNPALDLAAEANAVVPTHKIRMHQEPADPGGGGVNVARVLHELGGDVLAIVSAGGASGRVLEELLDEAGVPRRSVLIRGQTRVSLNVQDRESGLEYRFVPEGPTLSATEFQACLAAVEQEPGEWLIASGSLPHGVPDDAYAQIARIAARTGRRFVVDTSGVALAVALEQGGCELVKPSLSELGISGWPGIELPGGPGQTGHGAGPARRSPNGGGDPRGGRGLAGHRGRRDPGAGHGGGDAQFGRRGRCVPRGGGPRAGTWSLAGTCAGLGHRGRCDCHRVCRHSQAAAG
jgi:pfkB family carbohydrate kinase